MIHNHSYFLSLLFLPHKLDGRKIPKTVLREKDLLEARIPGSFIRPTANFFPHLCTCFTFKSTYKVISYKLFNLIIQSTIIHFSIIFLIISSDISKLSIASFIFSIASSTFTSTAVRWIDSVDSRSM